MNSQFKFPAIHAQNYQISYEYMVIENIIKVEEDLNDQNVVDYIDMQPIENSTHDIVLKRYNSTLKIVKMRDGEKTTLYQLNRIKKWMELDLLALCKVITEVKKNETIS